MKKYIYGIILCVITAILGEFLSFYIKGPGAICLAIISGIIIGNLLSNNLRSSAKNGINLIEKKVLPFAIALLGLELQIKTLTALGSKAFFVVIPAMFIGIISSIIIGKALGLSKRFSLLLGIGNSVCGSSAIIASAPSIRSKESEIGVAISAVNLAGTIGIFLIPLISLHFAFTEKSTSMLIGGSLQAIGQVAAAGYSLSNIIGNNSVLIKMIRVLMIGPIAIGLSIFFKSEDSKKGILSYVPLYIIGFVFFAITGSFFAVDNIYIIHLKKAANILLLLAMAAIGLKIHLKPLLKQGPKAFGLIIIITLIQIVSIITLIKIFN
ncbi:MAG: putative sulfate exporter family transporter [Candidatus Muiribacterium halophilum]|uniref:Putative sulfate exporter family transporter n=1 Tax=Muiribacterium halophilum TaxID=2053465 RepID=A0A2N5ZN86_MUIH1|nr:MAG: putative sulfate exporter family transporter [Candidatus Muirbacterium halophilum]